MKSPRLEMQELRVDLGGRSKWSSKVVADTLRGPRATSPGTCKSQSGMCFRFYSKEKSLEIF